MTNKTSVVSCVVLGTLLAAASVARAEPDRAAHRHASRTARPRPHAKPAAPPASAPAHPHARSYNFTGDTLDARRVAPDGTTIFGLRGPAQPSLIRLRGDFLREIARSAESIP